MGWVFVCKRKGLQEEVSKMCLGLKWPEGCSALCGTIPLSLTCLSALALFVVECGATGAVQFINNRAQTLLCPGAVHANAKNKVGAVPSLLNSSLEDLLRHKQIVTDKRTSCFSSLGGADSMFCLFLQAEIP